MRRNSWILQPSFFEVLFFNPILWYFHLNWSTGPWQYQGSYFPFPISFFSFFPAHSDGQKATDFNQSSNHHFVMREENSYFRIWFFAFMMERESGGKIITNRLTLCPFLLFLRMCWKPDRVLVWNRTLWMIHIGGTIPYTRNVGNSWNTENRCCKKRQDVIRQCDEMNRSTCHALELG